MSIELILGIISGVGSIVAIIFSLRKQPHEIRDLDAKAAKAYAEAAELASKRAESSIKQFTEEIEGLKERLTIVEEENALLKDWAERLVCQVEELGGTPVKMKTKTKKVSSRTEGE